MKRFLVLGFIILILSAGVFFYLIRYTEPFTGQPPEFSLNYQNIIFFILSLFFFLTSLVSLVLYFISRLSGDYQEPRYTYRRSLRRGALVGLGTVIIAILLLTRTANLLTILLTIGVMVSLEFTLRG